MIRLAKISGNEVERLKQETAERGRHSLHMSVVLSLLFSLATVVILSKKNLTNSIFLDLAVFAVPIPISETESFIPAHTSLP